MGIEVVVKLQCDRCTNKDSIKQDNVFESDWRILKTRQVNRDERDADASKVILCPTCCLELETWHANPPVRS